MNKERYLTISVDDGHPADLRSAELLSRHGLRATFYIPKINPEREVMGESDIKMISGSFEIGAHTYSHKPLWRIPQDEMRREIRESKDWLEQLLGREAAAFCYPQGRFNALAVNAVRDSGFKGARTCMYNLMDFPANPFLWGVSTHAYTHPRAVQIRHALLERNFKGAMNFLLIQKATVDWAEQFRLSVKYVEENGGVAHLYLHSWEIDKLNEWARLEELLGCLSEQKSLKRVTNGELFTAYYDQKG